MVDSVAALYDPGSEWYGERGDDVRTGGIFDESEWGSRAIVGGGGEKARRVVGDLKPSIGAGRAKLLVSGEEGRR